MNRFKNILLVLSPDSEELVALARAVTLARQNQARLHVFVVLEHLPLDELPLGTRTLLGILDREGLREMIVQRQRRLLRTGLTEPLDRRHRPEHIRGMEPHALSDHHPEGASPGP